MKGFTLIELLIVIAIIGIVAAIAIPNLMNSFQKSKQKSTMGNIKSVGSALESYLIDWGFVPNDNGDSLNIYLVPFHINQMPLRDGWGFTWFYLYGEIGTESQDIYSIASGGRDGVVDWNITGAYWPSSISDFRNDIIFSCGRFTRYPSVR